MVSLSPAPGENALKKLLIILVVLLLLGAAVAAVVMPKLKAGGAWSGSPGGGPAVRVQSAQRGTLVEIVSAPGKVVPETKVSISARVSAKITALPFKEGDAVTRGDGATGVAPSVLVRLDATDIEAGLRAAQARFDGQRAEIDTAKARIDARQSQVRSLTVQLENRQTELQRQESLLASNDVARQAVDDIRAAVKQLSVQIEGELGSIAADKKQLTVLEFQAAAAQAEIDRIRDSLNYTTILSPIDGLVTKVKGEVGEIAVTGTMNNAGTVILEVADLSKMLVEARVDETDIGSLKVGQKAIVRMQAFDGVLFDGVVQTVALARTEQISDRTEYYEVKILLDTQGKHVVSGLNADVEIQTESHPGVIRIPNQAVLPRPVDALPVGIREKPEVDQNRSFAPVVFRLVNGKSVITPVKVGASDITHTMITSGIEEGDPIIVGPFKQLDTMGHDQPFKEETAATQPATQAAK